MPVNALIFDFDGLILDTETPLFDAWKDIYRQNGVELSLEEYATCVGSTFSVFDPARRLAELTGRQLDLLELHDKANAVGGRQLRKQILQPGFPGIFEEARRLGMKLAVASSSSREWVTGNLRKRKLTRFFDFVCTAEDVVRVKPDPALYLTALRGLGIFPAEALAFEDSPNGVTAALAAGIRCVAVPNPVTRQLPLGHASIVLDSLGGCTLEEILARVDQQGD